MLLALDIGNSTIHMGLFDGERLLSDLRAKTDRAKTADEYGKELLSFAERFTGKDKGVSSVYICSVVPQIEPIIDEAVRRRFDIEPVFIESEKKLGISIKVDNPSEVGADRIVNSVAAYRKYGGPSIVVDFGTAITFDLISGRGEYMGGIICPGTKASHRGLVENASRLFEVEFVPMKKLIGKNTTEALQSGMYWGLVGEVEGILFRLKDNPSFKNATVIATGGDAELIFKEIKLFDHVDTYLTLEGLRIIWDMNK